MEQNVWSSVQYLFGHSVQSTIVCYITCIVIRSEVTPGILKVELQIEKKQTKKNTYFYPSIHLQYKLADAQV